MVMFVKEFFLFICGFCGVLVYIIEFCFLYVGVVVNVF